LPASIDWNSVLNKLLTKYRAIPVPAKAAMWFAICSVVTNCISMLTMPLFTRLMSTDQYGVYSIYNTWLQMFTVVATLRLNYAVFNKGMSKYAEDRDTYTASMQTLTTAIVIVCIAVYLPLADFVNGFTGLSTLVTLLIFVEIIFASAVSYWMARKRYEYSYRAIILTTIAISLGNAGFGLLAVLLNEQKDLARIVSCVLVQCIVGGILYIVNLKHARKAFCWDYVKFALLFNLPLLPHYAAMYVLDAFDRIMIQTMVGFSAAALYSVACNLGNVLKIVTNSINNSIVPWMYEKLGQGEYEKLGKTTTAVIVIPVIPVLMLIAVGPEIIWLFGGDKYAAAQYVIPPIAEALVFSFTYTVFTNIEFFFDKNKFVMFASIVASVLNVALNYLLIGPFGYVAAAYTTLLCYALMAAAHYIYVRRLFAQKKIKCPFSGMVLVGMTLLLVGLGFVLTLLYPYAIARLIFFTVCLVALFIFRNKITTLLKSVKKKR